MFAGKPPMRHHRRSTGPTALRPAAVPAAAVPGCSVCAALRSAHCSPNMVAQLAQAIGLYGGQIFGGVIEEGQVLGFSYL